jgi:hypothetical protein
MCAVILLSKSDAVLACEAQCFHCPVRPLLCPESPAFGGIDLQAIDPSHYACRSRFDSKLYEEKFAKLSSSARMHCTNCENHMSVLAGCADLDADGGTIGGRPAGSTEEVRARCES